ncbi:uncharacterized protein LOC135150603 [Daucus carota subsp. sativus]|uniref:uncharacterized protein LOC135150603 n=1 Tax=Daucus carota subsp. sativus TaxID=79200 RepID=UPI0030831CCA
MMLNPAKCAFGVGSGKFLGLMVSKRGIEANPDKIKAILDMEPPKSIRDVQKLTGRIAALGRFVSKSGDKCLPFFKALKKVKNFEWTEESQVAFEELKKYMAEPPLLSKPIDGETLYVYLAVSEQALSAVLVREEFKVQKPVYYVSKVLHGAELNYSVIEKFALAMITASRKLRPYFQSHKIEVLTDQPLRNVIHSPKASGRLIKWAIELGEFDIRYKPRTAIKAQALADFLVECSGAGLVLQSPDGFTVEYAIKLDFPTTNNEAEYEALIAGLGLARTLRVKNLKVCGDSKLVVFQVNGEFEAREETMLKYLRIVKTQMALFEECSVEYVPREENTKADALSQFASSDDEVYLQGGHLPPNADEARKLQVRALKYVLIEGVLYRKSFVIPYLRCLRPDEAREALREVHEGVCGQHLGGRALAHKVTRLGFNWPDMLKHAQDYVKRCDRCQRFAPIKRVEKAQGSWADEILPILWAYRTTCKVSTGATPFQLAYGAEAVVPLEITHTSSRVQQYEPEANEEGMRLALDMIDEIHDEAHAKIVENQKRASYYYNLRVKERYFREGDLVLRKIEASGVGPKGKMAPNWEGPYQVKAVTGHGSYKLQTLEGVEVPRSWHATNLKIYYV